LVLIYNNYQFNKRNNYFYNKSELFITKYDTIIGLVYLINNYVKLYFIIQIINTYNK